MKQLTEDKFKEIINYQMELNWYTERFEDLQKIDNWYSKFPTTKEKEEEFKTYLKKELKSSVIPWRLDREIGHFILWYWLTIKD